MREERAIQKKKSLSSSAKYELSHVHEETTHRSRKQPSKRAGGNNS